MNMTARVALLMMVCSVAVLGAENKNRQVFEKISGEVSRHSQVYGNLKNMTSTIGHRLTGSENGSRAEEFVYRRFREYGFEKTRYVPFRFTGWFRGRVSFSVAKKPEAPERKLAVVSLASTPEKADVAGELIDMGNGLAEDYARLGRKVEGKIVLACLGILPDSGRVKNVHRSQKVALAVQHKALGVVFFNRVKSRVLITGTASIHGKPVSIPAVCISYEDGMELKNQLKSKTLQGKIKTSNRICASRARNVAATLEGSDLKAETIVIGGHLDSWDLSVGAIDNGIGSMTVLDVARTFKALNLKPRRTIEFVLFMGEEQGILGSGAYVRHLVDSGRISGVKYMINLDMTGNPVGFYAGAERKTREYFALLGESIRQVEPVFTNKYASGSGIYGDGKYFLLQGIPCMSFISNLDGGVYRYYHSNRDSFDLVNEKHLQNTVRFTAMTLYALACSDDLPENVRSDREIREYLCARGLKENLLRSGDWRWEK